MRDSKLAQAYSLLVPIRERPVSGSVKEFDHEDGSNPFDPHWRSYFETRKKLR